MGELGVGIRSVSRDDEVVMVICSYKDVFFGPNMA